MVDEERKKSKVSMTIPKAVGLPTSNKSMAVMASKSVGRLFGIKSMSRMKMRKMSFGFGGVSGIKTVDTSSQVAPEYKRPPLLFTSTYQLDPHPDQVFNVPRVTKMANRVLDSHWNGHVYNISESPTLALYIAGEMMRSVKRMNFNRYRIISIVTIGQKRSQSYNNAITFLWDHQRDNYADVQRECTSNFIHVTVFGIYLD